MYTPLSLRGDSIRRTVEGMVDDNERFLKAGVDLKKAKGYSKCISKPFFSIPISQVQLGYLNQTHNISLTMYSRYACQDYILPKAFFRRSSRFLKRLAMTSTSNWHFIIVLKNKALTLSMQLHCKH